MTYLEIIEWIENRLEYFEMGINEVYKLGYIDDEGLSVYELGKDLISIVLEINNKELIK